MYVRRNQRNRFFKERNRKPSVFRRFFMMLVVIMIAGGVAFWQQDWVLDTVNEFLGPPVTPTPLPGALALDAQEVFWQGDLAGSAEIWERAVALRPDSIDYLYEYGMVLIDLDDGRNNNVQRAEELAMQILELDPNDPRGYALRARALVWTGNSSLALTVARAGLDISPEFAPLHAALSRAHIGEGNLRDAQEAGVLAIEYGSGDVRSYWAYASSLAFSGARDEAIVEYERTVATNPAFLPPYFELANLYLATNRDQEAIDTYNRILGVQPTNARALLRQCQSYRKVGQFNEARGLCEDAVTSDPSYVPALYQLAQIQYSNSEFDSANELFQTCVDLDGNNLECTYYLGLTQYYLAQAEYNNVCLEEGLSASECQAQQTCQVGWNLLQEALVMTENRANTEGSREVITTGLTAIQDDPACRGVSGLPISTPQPDVETTPETTPEVTAEA
ncbi:MAG: tetratricopeptide repeat protein [Anaerolineae bacterium]